MTDTLNKKDLLEVLDRIAEYQDSRKKGAKVASVVKGIIIKIERGKFDTKEPDESKFSIIPTALNLRSLLDDLLDNRDNPSDGISLERAAGINIAIEKITSGRYDLDGLYQKEPAE